MAFPLELTVDCGDGRKIQASFLFVAGRYRHSIQLCNRQGQPIDNWHDEVESGDEDWPASPPIQQLSLETIGDSATLLGVGQAGKAHWSISVETASIHSRAAIKFDLACRTQRQPHWLGSTYRRDLALIDTAPSLQMFADTLTYKTSSDNHISTCSLEPVANRKFPATLRWIYLISTVA